MNSINIVIVISITMLKTQRVVMTELYFQKMNLVMASYMYRYIISTDCKSVSHTFLLLLLVSNQIELALI